jgi:hypothetical protein
METGIGFKGIAGVIEQAAWGTADEVTNKIPLISESIEVQPQLVDHDYLDEFASGKKQDGVLYPPAGSLETYVPFTVKNSVSGKFVSIDPLLLLALGSNTYHAETINYNRIVPLDDLNVFGTLAINKGLHSDKVNELIGMMINSMSISGNAGEAIKASFEVQGQELVKDAVGVNTPTILSALPTDLANLLLFSDLTFRLGNQVDALDSGDNLGISAFTISVNNNLTSAEQSSPDNTASHTSPTKPIQPIRNGFREVTLDITIPRYVAETLWTAKNADTLYQAEFLFSRVVGVKTYLFNIFLPNLHIQTTEDAMSGAGALQQTVSFKAHRFITGLPMTFTEGTPTTDSGEIWIELSNDRVAVI